MHGCFDGATRAIIYVTVAESLLGHINSFLPMLIHGKIQSINTPNRDVPFFVPGVRPDRDIHLNYSTKR